MILKQKQLKSILLFWILFGYFHIYLQCNGRGCVKRALKEELYGGGVEAKMRGWV